MKSDFDKVFKQLKEEKVEDNQEEIGKGIGLAIGIFLKFIFKILYFTSKVLLSIWLLTYFGVLPLL